MNKEDKRKYFEEELKVNPNSAKMYYQYAVLLKNKFSEYNLAMLQCVKALEIDPNYLEAHRLLGYLYISSDEGNYCLSKYHYEKILAIKPNDSDALFNVGFNYYIDLHEYDKAKYYFEKSIEADPEFDEAHQFLSYLLVEQFSDFENAKFHHEKAVALNKRNADIDLENRIIHKCSDNSWLFTNDDELAKT